MARSKILLTGLLMACLRLPSAVFSQTVSTTVGDIVGYSDSVSFDGSSKLVLKFLGIPYAVPPINAKRFAKPETLTELPQSPYNATYQRPFCPQNPVVSTEERNMNVSEDCLHLNIYVPGQAPLDTNKKMAVMIWIYNSAPGYGGAAFFDGGILSAFNDVIVVTFNYRVSVFGFLSCGANNCLGNYGLYDQRLAIKWVHDNIEYFGGDQNKVTIFGSSAGAAHGIIQGIYPGNTGYINRIIAQSGTPVGGEWKIQDQAEYWFHIFASDTGCSDTDTDNVLQCLRAKPLDELVGAIHYPDQFWPVVDGDIIPVAPGALFSGQTAGSRAALQKFSDLDLLMGVNSKDGAMLVPLWALTLSKQSPDITNGLTETFVFNHAIPLLLTEYLGIDSNLMLQVSVMHEYTDFTDPADDIKRLNQVIDLSTDIVFFQPGVHTLNLHDGHFGNGTTYQYLFTHKPSFVPEPVWLNGARTAIEIPFVFGLPDTFVLDTTANSTAGATEEEVALSRLVMKLWTNFAKFGEMTTDNPLPYGWPQYTLKDQYYLELSPATLSSPSTNQRLAERRMDFWFNVVPRLLVCKTNCEGCETCPNECITQGAIRHSAYALYMWLLLICVFMKFYM